MNNTIEDLLSFVVSIEDSLLPSDKGILVSIDRQIKKGSALTDRQFVLVKTKLALYRDFLVSTGFNDFDQAIETLKFPLRSVDRSKSITVDGDNILVKFPFNKKTIVVLESVATKCKPFYSHQKGSNIHNFKLNEVTTEAVVEAFNNKNFYIDEELLLLYKKVKEVKMNPELVIPGIYGTELKNFKKSAIEFIENELGSVTSENLIKFYDRRRRYGIAHISCKNPGNLLGHIAFRENTEITIDPLIYTMDNIVEAVINLDRFPLLILVDEDKALEQVANVYNAFSNVVPTDKQTVLFREDNKDNYNLNNFIHERNLNNWLDKSTQLVYISKNKLPKLLLRSEWKPLATLAISSYRANTNVLTYVKDVCDLIMYHDKDMSIIGSKNRYANY